jgi:hypothetical protein
MGLIIQQRLYKTGLAHGVITRDIGAGRTRLNQTKTKKVCSHKFNISKIAHRGPPGLRRRDHTSRGIIIIPRRLIIIIIMSHRSGADPKSAVTVHLVHK